MKKLIIKNPTVLVGAWFAIMTGVALLLLSSCATRYVGCDAYGSVDRENGMGYQIMTVEKANELSK